MKEVAKSNGTIPASHLLEALLYLFDDDRAAGMRGCCAGLRGARGEACAVAGLCS